jgi:ABC-2 family transporter protein
MLRNVFTKTLWDARRSLLGWALAIGAVAVLYAAFWPTVNTPEMQDALRNYPEGVLEAFNYNDLTSPAGYLGSSVYGLLIPLLVAVFAIAYGTRAVAGDEEAGTLELLLAHPVSRTQLALQRFAALTTALALALVGALLWLGMLAIAGPAELADITAAEFAAATTQLGLFGACLGALAFAVGAATGPQGPRARDQRRGGGPGLPRQRRLPAGPRVGVDPRPLALALVPGRRATQERPPDQRRAAAARGHRRARRRRQLALQPPRRRRLSWRLRPPTICSRGRWLISGWG